MQFLNGNLYLDLINLFNLYLILDGFIFKKLGSIPKAKTRTCETLRVTKAATHLHLLHSTGIQFFQSGLM